MPQYSYRGRDKEGQLRVGQRDAPSEDKLNQILIKEGIYPIHIKEQHELRPSLETIKNLLQSKTLHLEELAIFARQMQLLYKANVPIITSLKQLSSYTRSHKLQRALKRVIEDLEKGQSLSSSMQNYPDVFTPLMINLVQIGENTGDISGAFSYVHDYLSFELSNAKQLKTAFRYPIFVLVTIAIAIILLNVFVIPTFAHFYERADITLPWQTIALIMVSHFFVHYGLYTLAAIIIMSIFLYRYIQTPEGKYRWDSLKLKVPLFGKLLKRLILIRFSQSLAITLNAGLSITKSLELVRNVLQNNFVNNEINQMQESIE